MDTKPLPPKSTLSSASQRPSEDRSPPEELHFALVRPLGTDIAKLIQHLRACLAIYGFQVEVVKLSQFIDHLAVGLPSRDRLYEYYTTHMDAGDDLRRRLGNEILAQHAIKHVYDLKRSRAVDPPMSSIRGVAYVYDSLMHPSEVASLRQVYGPLAFVIAIHADEAIRKAALIQQLLSGGTRDMSAAERQAVELLARDRGRASSSRGPAPHRLSFERTFHFADVFLDGSDDRRDIAGGESSDPVVQRFLRQLFSYPHGTPTNEENAMAMAFVAARRSGALSRQVGAAIVRADGTLVSLGCNEVPRFGGGVYTSDDPNNQNDVRYTYRADQFRIIADDVIGADSNDLVKLEILEELLARSAEAGLLSSEPTTDLRVAKLLATPELHDLQYFDIIAYGRTVHAEMDAVTTAARTGVTIAGCNLFVTTFPCHECARHIISTGLTEVVFIEPYPKSRVAQLHADSVQVQGSQTPAQSQRVIFRPFTGISPSRQMELYSLGDRKHDDPREIGKYGRAMVWSANSSQPLRRSIVGGPVTQSLRSPAISLGESLTARTLESRNAVAEAHD
jgi:deoxycytidylate deaminase